MHEAYLAECILRQTCESLPADAKPDSVTSVKLRVGELDAVVPDMLRELFDMFKSNFELFNASLCIEREAVWCHCKECGAQFSLDSPIFICPQCRGNCVKLLRGRGITLTEITLSDQENENSHHSQCPRRERRARRKKPHAL